MQKPTGRGVHYWLPAIVLLVGVLCTGTVDHWVSKSLDRQTRALLESRHAQFTEVVQQAINQRLLALDVMGRSLSGDQDKPALFQRYANSLLRRLPDIANFDRIVTISDDERALVEQKLSRASGQFITLGEWDESGNTRTAPHQPRYQVITQVADRKHSDTSLGLVAPSVPHWRQPIETALQHEKVSATAQTRILRNGTSEVSVRLFRALDDGSLVSLALSPHQLLQDALPGRLNPALQVTVFDLDQHLKTPLFATPKTDTPQGAWALRSAINIADREWILTTTPDKHFMEAPVERIEQILWLVGIATTLLASALVWLLCLRLNRSRDDHKEAAQALAVESRTLENSRIEKTALKQALQNSEQRTRDLVEIAGSCIAELDEHGRIGYISAQAVDLLGRPPAEFQDQPFSNLIAPRDRERFQQNLIAARQKRQTVRVDLAIQVNDDDPRPVTLRAKPVVDTLTGCAGFRLSIHSRSSD